MKSWYLAKIIPCRIDRLSSEVMVPACLQNLLYFTTALSAQLMHSQFSLFVHFFFFSREWLVPITSTVAKTTPFATHVIGVVHQRFHGCTSQRGLGGCGRPHGHIKRAHEVRKQHIEVRTEVNDACRNTRKVM